MIQHQVSFEELVHGRAFDNFVSRDSCAIKQDVKVMDVRWSVRNVLDSHLEIGPFIDALQPSSLSVQSDRPKLPLPSTMLITSRYWSLTPCPAFSVLGAISIPLSQKFRRPLS